MRQSGFSLLELMVTVALVAILAALAFPSFQNTIQSTRLATGTNEIIATLNGARSAAVRASHPAYVCGRAESRTGVVSCATSWDNGAIAWVDSNGDGSRQTTERIIHTLSLSDGGLAVTGPAAMIGFDPRGRRINASDQQFVVKPTSCKQGAPLQRTLTVNFSGQVKTAKGNCP